MALGQVFGELKVARMSTSLSLCVGRQALLAFRLAVPFVLSLSTSSVILRHLVGLHALVMESCAKVGVDAAHCLLEQYSRSVCLMEGESGRPFVQASTWTRTPALYGGASRTLQPATSGLRPCLFLPLQGMPQTHSRRSSAPCAAGSRRSDGLPPKGACGRGRGPTSHPSASLG